ncbi:MAG: hypothetical protein ACE5MM_04890 [Nitrospiraceae bacterium]
MTMETRETQETRSDVSRLIRVAVLVCLIGLACNLVFLLFGFQAWTIGIGLMVGWPILFTAVVLYLIAVYRDLIKRRIL